jgi:hypothetical protein
MLGIVFAQCRIHSLSPVVTGQKGRLAFGLRRASLQRLRESMAITSSWPAQKGVLAALLVSKTVESWNEI